jgi:hypothetical protein
MAVASPHALGALLQPGVQKFVYVFRLEPAIATESDAVAIEHSGVRPAANRVGWTFNDSATWETVDIALPFPLPFPLAVSLLPFLLATALTKLPHLTKGSILLDLRYKTNQLIIQRDNL